MRSVRIACVWIVALLMCAQWAAAESRWSELCGQGGVEKAHAAAWIEIPGAQYCGAVMRHGADDSYYAARDASGAESEHGALYIQPTYNAADFSDPVTVIYGSSRAEGAPLRNLQELYSGSFEENRKILLHLPEETVEYEVFAALPYTSVHILHYYDFSVQRRYEGFIDGVYAQRKLGMNLDEGSRPEYGEKLLILSTGLRGDSMQRYLVLARQTTEE